MVIPQGVNFLPTYETNSVSTPDVCGWCGLESPHQINGLSTPGRCCWCGKVGYRKPTPYPHSGLSAVAHNEAFRDFGVSPVAPEPQAMGHQLNPFGITRFGSSVGAFRQVTPGFGAPQPFARPSAHEQGYFGNSLYSSGGGVSDDGTRLLRAIQAYAHQQTPYGTSDFGSSDGSSGEVTPDFGECGPSTSSKFGWAPPSSPLSVGAPGTAATCYSSRATSSTTAASGASTLAFGAPGTTSAFGSPISTSSTVAASGASTWPCAPPGTTSAFATPISTSSTTAASGASKWPFGPPGTTSAFASPNSIPSAAAASVASRPSFRAPGTSVFGSSISTPSTAASGASKFGIKPPFFEGWGTGPAGGSCTSTYTPTYEDCVGPTRDKLMSVSAMKTYNNTSHEELRSEYYKLQRNKGNLAYPPSTHGSGPSKQDHSNPSQPFTKSSESSMEPPQGYPWTLPAGYQVVHQTTSNTSNSPFGKSPSELEHAPQNTGTSSSKPQVESSGFNFECHQPKSAQTSSAPTPTPTPTVDANTPRATQGTTVGTNQPFAFFGPPTFVNFIHPPIAAIPAPNFGFFGLTVPLMGTHITPAMFPFGGQTMFPFGGPTMFPFGGPTPNFSRLDDLCGAPPNTPEPIATPITTSYGSPSTSFVGLDIPNVGNPRKEARSTDYSMDLPSFANLAIESLGDRNTCSNKPKVKKDADDSCHVPKGLEHFVEKLGFNPWSQDDSVSRGSRGNAWILPCEDAHRDDDIVALAQFAIAQYNALHKDDPVMFFQVIVACLEAVERGRYHIVLDVWFPTGCRCDRQCEEDVCSCSNSVKRCYAVVFRKGSLRFNHMTLLEKWLSIKA